METYEKRFWQELLNKVLQCENFSQCLFGKINHSLCPISNPEKYCETSCFKNLLSDWSPAFFQFYKNGWEKLRNNADSLKGEELCSFYLTILGIAVFFSSPKISQKTKPIFSEKAFCDIDTQLNAKNNKMPKELLEKFKKFTGDDAIKDFAAEIDMAFEHLSPPDFMRHHILVVLKVLADGFENSLSPVEELNPEGKEKLLDDVLNFLNKKRENTCKEGK